MTIKMPDKLTIRNAESFGEKLIRNCREAKEGEIVRLDFSDLMIICSTGLGKILHAYKICDEKGSELVIMNVSSEYVHQMFKMVHLDKMIRFTK